MSDMVVVVGAGLAGAKVVETLHDEGFDGQVTLIGDEQYRPYERPGLSKEVLQGKAEPDSLYVHEANYYADAGVETHFGDGAVSCDLTRRRVRLASGNEVPYDRLVLATGSRARTIRLPGAELAGVRTLRTMGDGLALRADLQAQRRIVLVGGGWIGLEAAAAARLAGCQVTVLERDPLPLVNVRGENIAGRCGRLHVDHGVDLRTRVSVEGFEGSHGVVTGVRVNGEVLPADVVLVGIGAVPNTGLAEDAGLVVDNGVVVDERLQTSDPNVWAAGDVANARNTLLGRRIRVEHWDNAIRLGRLAGLSVLDRPGGYDWLPYFYTDQYDLGMEYVGHASTDAEVVLRGSMADGEFIAFWLENGLVTAAMNVNIWDVNDLLRQVVGHRVDPERLRDPEVPLAELAD